MEAGLINCWVVANARTVIRTDKNGKHIAKISSIGSYEHELLTYNEGCEFNTRDTYISVALVKQAFEDNISAS